MKVTASPNMESGGKNRFESLMRARKTIVLLAVLAALIFTGGIAEEGPEAAPSEYQLKAAFLFNFAKFVEWPPEAFATSNTPFIIGIIGEDPFGADLERTVRGKSVNGRTFEIKPLRTLTEAGGCHILFISRSERKRVPEILKAASAASVLTVSEIERFTQAGGMVNFV